VLYVSATWAYVADTMEKQLFGRKKVRYDISNYRDVCGGEVIEVPAERKCEWKNGVNTFKNTWRQGRGGAPQIQKKVNLLIIPQVGNGLRRDLAGQGGVTYCEGLLLVRA